MIRMARNYLRKDIALFNIMNLSFLIPTMNIKAFEQIAITNGDIIGYTTNDNENHRCYYYGGYNQARGIFACYNFKLGRIVEVIIANIKTITRD